MNNMLQRWGRSMLTTTSSVVRLVAREVDGIIGAGGIENARDALDAHRSRDSDTFFSYLTPDSDVRTEKKVAEN